MNTPKAGNRLFSFQKTPSRWLALRFGVLLADEIGSGMTIQTIPSNVIHRATELLQRLNGGERP